MLVCFDRDPDHDPYPKCCVIHPVVRMSTSVDICQFFRHHRRAAAEGRGPPLVSIPLAYVGMCIGCFDQDPDPDPYPGPDPYLDPDPDT